MRRIWSYEASEDKVALVREIVSKSPLPLPPIVAEVIAKLPRSGRVRVVVLALDA